MFTIYSLTKINFHSDVLPLAKIIELAHLEDVHLSFLFSSK